MFNTLRAMYSLVLSCVRCNPRNSDYFNCMQELKQGCLISPILFSFVINELASEILRRKHGIQLLPREIELFLLMFADDIALLSSTPVGLQNQLNEVANRLGLLVNLEKTKKVVFKKLIGAIWQGQRDGTMDVSRSLLLVLIDTLVLSSQLRFV